MSFSISLLPGRRGARAPRSPLFRQIGVILCCDTPRTPVLDAVLATLAAPRRSLE